jgi:hypothetical protein
MLKSGFNRRGALRCVVNSARFSSKQPRIVAWSTPTSFGVPRGAGISCLPAVSLARFHLREIFNAREPYKPRSFLSQAAVDNLLLLHNFTLNSPEYLQELWPGQPSTALYTDASGTTGWGSVFEPPNEGTRSSAGWWASQEVVETIALKELKACRHGLHQNVEALRGCTVKLYQDNKAVVGAVRKMPSKFPALMAEIKELVPWLLENKIRLDVVLIRSEHPSQCSPAMEQTPSWFRIFLELLRCLISNAGSSHTKSHTHTHNLRPTPHRSHSKIVRDVSQIDVQICTGYLMKKNQKLITFKKTSPV